MISPFLKWAGGKRWLTSSSFFRVPETYNRYIEPFLGGGAVFFHLKPAKAILSDINADLIELYNVIRLHPTKLQKAMERHQFLHNKHYYYDVRKAIPTTALGRAARTLYLNRTCWNGLYRVNLKGNFNVPIGTKNSVVFDGEDFKDVSSALASAEIRCADFESVISESKAGDFLFVDPPYTVQHNLNGFVKYNENIFSWADQIRLCKALSAAASRDVAIVITNADHSSVRKLYSRDFRYQSIQRASVLAANASRRGRTSEAMFIANLS